MSHIAIIQADFYQDIADQLYSNASKLLEQSQATHDLIKVPGCFEIPAAVALAIAAKKYDGYIALGCVIRGETSHYDYVCEQSARGLNDLAINKLAPIGYGVITAENRDQANHRASKDGKNVGERAAIACLEMLKLNINMLK